MKISLVVAFMILILGFISFKCVDTVLTHSLQFMDYKSAYESSIDNYESHLRTHSNLIVDNNYVCKKR